MYIPALFMASTWTTIGTALSVASAIGQASAASTQYKAAAQANEYNALVARQRAEQARSVYGQREERQRREGRFLSGQRAAAIAQSGTGFGGSNLDIQTQSDVLQELDALNIRYAGELEATGLLAGAQLEGYEAEINRGNARNARTSGYLGAAGKLLSGTGSYLRIGGSSGGGALAPSTYSQPSSYMSGWGWGGP